MTLYPPPSGGPQFTAGSAPRGNQATQDLDVLIQQPLAFCTAGIFARLRQTSTAQSLASGLNAVHFDTVDEDPYSGWNGTSWYWSPPVGCSGWYHVTITAAVTYSSAVQMQAEVVINGTAQWTYQSTCPASPYLQCGSSFVYLFGGVDQLQAGIYSNGTGLTTDNTGGQQSTMQLAWISN